VSVRVRDLLIHELEALRYEPIDKRIRAELGGATVVDSTHALLVWEPQRVVPVYAVPEGDVAGELVPETGGNGGAEPAGVAPMGAPPELAGRPVYDPSIPFAVHTTDGEPLRLVSDGGEAGAFRAADPALAGQVLLDFDAFDAWYEEDEPNVGHPRDPFHRIDIVRSSRHVRIERDGEMLAESTRPLLLFEPPLPVRYYLPPEDVRMDRLQPSPTRSTCAYKGHAGYLALPGGEDVAWSYPEPLREAAEVTARVAFFNERVDIVVDGERLARPVTPWSRRRSGA
jgi:uncharacterized protein (DUF427 family)